MRCSTSQRNFDRMDWIRCDENKRDANAKRERARAAMMRAREREAKGDGEAERKERESRSGAKGGGENGGDAAAAHRASSCCAITCLHVVQMEVSQRDFEVHANGSDGLREEVTPVLLGLVHLVDQLGVDQRRTAAQVEIDQLIERSANGLPNVNLEIVHAGRARNVAEAVADCTRRGRGTHTQRTGRLQ